MERIFHVKRNDSRGNSHERIAERRLYCVGHARTSDLRGEFECLVAKIRMTEGNVEGERSAKSSGEFALPTDDRRARFKAEASS